MRTRITEPPFASRNERDKPPWGGRGHWPAKWVACPGATVPFVAAMRLKFAVPRKSTVRIHVTADERYELWLDGDRIGRGSERGDARHWFFETYDLPLAKGKHTLVARVWALGAQAPFAQMTVEPGFLLAAEGEWTDALSTGLASWEARPLGGVAFANDPRAWGTGAFQDVDGAACPWGWETGEVDGWRPVEVRGPGISALYANEVLPSHLLLPAILPAMMEAERSCGVVRFLDEPPSDETAGSRVLAKNHLADEAAAWALTAGAAPLTVPPNTRRRAIIDLEDYVCAYPEAATSGGRGSRIRLAWAEALFMKPDGQEKGNRGEIEGKFFRGVADTFRPDGGRGRRFDTLWWRAGRYVEVFVETAEEPLVIERVTLRETRYPLEMEGGFEASDPRLAAVAPVLVRGLQMCSHETYMDCPYYEQLMYVGDTRLEVLATYAMTHDDRLPRKALAMFGASRLLGGLTQSRYPSRVLQVIPPFSLWWAAMVYDYALWRDDETFVRRLMPGVRGVVDAFVGFLSDDGLVQGPMGWNFMDWVPAWKHGIPPDGETGASGSINWQFVRVLGQMAELESFLGEKELAARNARLADDLARRAAAAFWSEKRGLMADDLSHEHFSEHTQCLALLTRRVDPVLRGRMIQGLLGEKDLERTTIYFAHYLFEVLTELGRIDLLVDRMGLWFDLPGLGFKTPLEHPEPSRSDCHAWASHPLYHYFASILGIRPASFGYRTVRIEPQLGPLDWARGRVVHPQGMIEADLRVDGAGLTGRIVLPPGVTGVYSYGRRTMALRPGAQYL